MPQRRLLGPRRRRCVGQLVKGFKNNSVIPRQKAKVKRYRDGERDTQCCGNINRLQPHAPPPQLSPPGKNKLLRGLFWVFFGVAAADLFVPRMRWVAWRKISAGIHPSPRRKFGACKKASFSPNEGGFTNEQAVRGGCHPLPLAQASSSSGVPGGRRGETSFEAGC